MSLLIFCFWRAPVFTFVKNGLKLLKDKALEITPKYRRTEAKVGLRVAERIIFETLQLILVLYFKMLSVALSGLVLIRIFLRRHICHLHANLLACFYEKHIKFLTSHIYFHLGNPELWKQYQSVFLEMMEHICDLETVKPQEMSIKVCVIYYNIEICYRSCGGKTSFPESFNISKRIVVGLPLVEGQKQPPKVFCKKKAFLKISQISRENSCVGGSF